MKGQNTNLIRKGCKLSLTEEEEAILDQYLPIVNISNLVRLLILEEIENYQPEPIPKISKNLEIRYRISPEDESRFKEFLKKYKLKPYNVIKKLLLREADKYINNNRS